MPIGLITTFRAADPARTRNLERVLAWYARMPDWELLVVEQDATPMLDSSEWPGSVRHVYLPNPGPFNKGWGLNVGAQLSRREVLYFCDADLLLPHDALATASSLCQRRVLAVNPYDHLRELNRDETEAILNGTTEPDFDPAHASRGRGDREQLNFCGGAFLMRRDLHRRLGGFDERYVGWGAEDDAMSLKLGRFTSNVAQLELRAAVHLWHPRPEAQTFGNPHYERNRARLERLGEISDDQLVFLCDLQRQIMGNPDKYLRVPDNEVETGGRTDARPTSAERSEPDG